MFETARNLFSRGRKTKEIKTDDQVTDQDLSGKTLEIDPEDASTLDQVITLESKDNLNPEQTREASTQPELRVQVDSVSATDASGKSIEVEVPPEISQSSVEFLNTELIAGNLPERPSLDPQKEGLLKINMSDSTTFHVPKEISFYSPEERARRKKAGEPIKKYRLLKMIGKGAYGAVLRAVRIDNLDRELDFKNPKNIKEKDLEGLEQVVVKFGSDNGNDLRRRRMLREIGLHAVANYNEADPPELSRKMQADYQRMEQASGVGQTRDIQASSAIPEFKGVITYPELGLGNVYATCLEYIEGGDLDKAEKKGGFSPTEGMKLMRTVLDALMELHKNGILHRDIKPANIMATPENPEAAKLGDLGIGKDVFFKESFENTVAAYKLRFEMDWRYKAMMDELEEKTDQVSVLMKLRIEAARNLADEYLSQNNTEGAKVGVQMLENLYNSMHLDEGATSFEFKQVSSPVVTGEGGAAGTPRYMNENAMQGNDDPVNDIYALGITMLEVVDGAADINDTSDLMEIVRAVKNGEMFDSWTDEELEEEFESEAEREFVKLCYQMAESYEYDKKALENQQRLKEYIKKISRFNKRGIELFVDSKDEIEKVAEAGGTPDDLAGVFEGNENELKKRLIPERELPEMISFVAALDADAGKAKHVLDILEGLRDKKIEPSVELMNQLEEALVDVLDNIRNPFSEQGVFEVSRQLDEIMYKRKQELGEAWQGPIRELTDEEREAEQRERDERMLAGLPEEIESVGEFEGEEAPEEAEAEEERKAK